jgi:hypothetical protein
MRQKSRDFFSGMEAEQLAKIKAQVDLAQDTGDPDLIKTLWNAQLLRVLEWHRDSLLLSRVVDLLMSLKINDRLRETTAENQWRALELLQLAVRGKNRDAALPVWSMIKKREALFSEALDVGQSYCDDLARADANLRSSLRRIGYQGDSSTVMLLVVLDDYRESVPSILSSTSEATTTASSTTTTTDNVEQASSQPQPNETKNALLTYLFEKFAGEWDLDKHILQLRKSHRATIVQWFFVHCDRPDMISRVSDAWFHKVHMMIRCTRDYQLYQCGVTLCEWIKWLEAHFTFFVASEHFRVDTVRAVLRAMTEILTGIKHTPQRERKWFSHTVTEQILRNAYRIKFEEKPLILDDLSAYWRAVEQLSSLQATGRARSDLLAIIVAAENEHDSAALHRRQTHHSTTNAGDLVEGPWGHINKMSSAELITAMTQYPEHALRHRDEYATAVSLKLHWILSGGRADYHQYDEKKGKEKQQGYHDDDDVDDEYDVISQVHQMLRSMTALLHAYAQIPRGRFDALLEDRELVTQYSNLLALFVEPVPLSLEGLAQLCPCCAHTYHECIIELGDINRLVELGPATTDLYRQLYTLVELPHIERRLWREEAPSDNRRQQEEEPASLYDELSDDGGELGHYEEEEEDDNDKTVDTTLYDNL